MLEAIKSRFETIQLVVATAGLAIGGLITLLGMPEIGGWVWAGGAAFVFGPTLYESVRSLAKGDTGVDIIAVLAIASALVLGEYLAAAIIGLMLTGGEALEAFAVSRARRELKALLERAPREAHRIEDGQIVDVDVNDVRIGDRLLVKPGEVIPADGILVSESGVLDESALTGEARPVELNRGETVRSGAANEGSPIELRVTASAEDSTFAAIVRLVKSAEASKAPFVRLADRFALHFLFVTLVMAGIAWGVSGDPVRALAVLVVATPCPLILAAPAAIIAGVSRAARHGIIVKGGGPLETLARATQLLLDKTGTITRGEPRVAAIEPFGRADADEMLRLAGSLEQMSTHPFAPAIVREAHARSAAIAFPTDVEEKMGTGIAGTVDGRRVAIGQHGWVGGEAPHDEGVSSQIQSVRTRTAVEGSSSAFVAIDGELVGAFILQDPIRTEAPRALQSMRSAGIERILMVTGDRPDIADLVGDAVGVDKVYAERAPDEKVAVIEAVREHGTTVMVGDGVNDAPALALADVGVAMGARGATVASEAADIVLTADRLEGLVAGVRISQRTRRIALQSVLAGMGMSIVAMVAAAAGYLTPVAGALLQEVIDVAVILNALRALGGGLGAGREVAGSEALREEMEEAHEELRPRVEEIAQLANRLDVLDPGEARAELERLRDFLFDELLPHEQEEQRSAYPAVAAAMRDEDPTGPLVHTHREIARLARLYARRVEQLPPDGVGEADIRDLRRALYGLHAVLTLHFAQEEEVYQALGSSMAV